jgi:hypothetical protein
LGEEFTLQCADVGEQQRICCPAKLGGAIERIQWFTIVWMCIEVGVSLFTAIRARSIALAAFGADSVIELLSAATLRDNSSCCLLAAKPLRAYPQLSQISEIMFVFTRYQVFLPTF